MTVADLIPAMEDALVLARTSKRVTVVHRREAFHKASHTMASRVLEHPKITVQWSEPQYSCSPPGICLSLICVAQLSPVASLTSAGVCTGGHCVQEQASG